MKCLKLDIMFAPKMILKNKSQSYTLYNASWSEIRAASSLGKFPNITNRTKLKNLHSEFN